MSVANQMRVVDALRAVIASAADDWLGAVDADDPTTEPELRSRLRRAVERYRAELALLAEMLGGSAASRRQSSTGGRR
jgi:hypothetical protein